MQHGRSWSAAMRAALYGPGGFYRAGAGPAAHFRTSVHASALFAAALHRLATAAGLRRVVDVGAGRGELLRQLAALDPELALCGVELADRPADLPAAIGWSATLPDAEDALLVGNEWLDNVPVDVVEATPDGPRSLLVDSAGAERAGDPPDEKATAWLARWWPLRDVGDRAEIGLERDARWAAAVWSLRRGLAVAIDYAHVAGQRPPAGTLTGYRAGRPVPPVPDGSCDLTAHVALDACAAAGQAAGAAGTVLLTQRAALLGLGVSGQRPARELAERDPAAYVRALQAASDAGELTDPGGLGGFCWLVQSVGMPVPGCLTCLPSRP